MSYDILKHDIDKLTNDDDEKIAVLALAIQRLMEEEE